MKIASILKWISAIYLIFAVAIGFTLFKMNESQQEQRLAYERQTEFKQLGIDLANASDYLTNQARRYVQFGEKEYYDNYWREVNETQIRDQVVQRLKEMNAPEEELALIEEAKNNSDALVETEEAAMAAVEEGNFDRARQLMFDENYDQNKAIIMEPIEEFLQMMNQRAQNETAKSEQILNIYLYVTYSLIFLMFLLVIATFFILFKKIRPLTEISHYIKRLASNEGDLTVRLPVKSKDEIGTISRSFNQMMENMQSLIKNIHRTIQETTDASNILNDKTVEVTTSTDEISSAIQQVAEGSKTQEESAEQTAKVTEEMSIGVQDIANSMQSVTESSNDTTEAAMSGNQLITQANQQMRTINEMVTESAKVTNSLGERSHEISQIINLIQDVAEQTNLLALNAAIEAARAGDHGKGFAVVADEVRKLAEQTNEATKNVTSLITSIQQDSQSSVQSMNTIEKEVSEGLHVIEQTGSSFQDILEAIKGVSKQVEEVSATSEEISASTEEVSASAEEMASIVSESSNHANNVAEQSVKQQHVMNEMKQSIQSQTNQLSNLKEQIARFTV
ncbi:HAMP domain-containing methyl-accepting chemotaxis protein [Gracilibacillus sp. YIM 98692]|uniref:methyl-accepting chemotaxis protein n=1 Tax=Gracilibacillus sp. YIM 98692 TaxID=2663532 RepID=UPI0013D84FA8|nr:HAMP domain-containing methyl-accepting chemotaxis protein [Gracilibacillus sp. YIM 98692]